MEFLTGRIGKSTIGKLTVWPNLVVIEARSNTTECKEILNETLHWAAMKFDLNFTPEMITRYAYVSDLSFTSEAPLLSFDPLIERIADRVSSNLSDIWLDPVHYEQFEFKIGHDPLARKWGIAPFQIARLAEHKFAENKYFSEAPLPTDLHIELLEEYEKGIIERRR